MLPPLSRERSDRFWLTATRDTFVATATGFGLLAVRDARDNAERLRGGRAWQRLHLHATARGLALHPLNQPRSEEHTSELQSLAYLVCRLLLEKKKKKNDVISTSLTHCPTMIDM